MCAQVKKEKKRKFTDWKVTHDKTICIVCWQDNGVVTLASSFAGSHEMDKATWRSESQKNHILVDRPKCV